MNEFTPGTICTWEELVKYLEDIEDCRQPAVHIKHVGMEEEAIVFLLSEGIGGLYGSGDCIAHWAGGDSGVCGSEDAIKIIKRIF